MILLHQSNINYVNKVQKVSNKVESNIKYTMEHRRNDEVQLEEESKVINNYLRSYLQESENI